VRRRPPRKKTRKILSPTTTVTEKLHKNNCNFSESVEFLTMSLGYYIAVGT
jgi:hypothetical protein